MDSTNFLFPHNVHLRYVVIFFITILMIIIIFPGTKLSYKIILNNEDILNCYCYPHLKDEIYKRI